MELLNFIFTNPFTSIGTLLLLGALVKGAVRIIRAVRAQQPQNARAAGVPAIPAGASLALKRRLLDMPALLQTPFDVLVLGGVTGSGRSTLLKEALAQGSLVNLWEADYERKSPVELKDLTLPESGTVGIDHATALSREALASLLLSLQTQGRKLVLGTAEPTSTHKECVDAFARAGIVGRVALVVV